MTNGGDVSPGTYATPVFNLITPVIKKALDDPHGAHGIVRAIASRLR